MVTTGASHSNVDMFRTLKDVFMYIYNYIYILKVFDPNKSFEFDVTSIHNFKFTYAVY